MGIRQIMVAASAVALAHAPFASAQETPASSSAPAPLNATAKTVFGNDEPCHEVKAEGDSQKAFVICTVQTPVKSPCDTDTDAFPGVALSGIGGTEYDVEQTVCGTARTMQGIAVMKATQTVTTQPRP
jgi:hypothetical protein